MWAMLAQMMTIIMDGMTKAIVTWDQTQEGCKKRYQWQNYKSMTTGFQQGFGDGFDKFKLREAPLKKKR